MSVTEIDGMGLLLKAVEFAAEKHRDQRRKGAEASPYINHPIKVASMLANIGGLHDVTVLAAAVLHDTIEDTCTTPDELENVFSSAIRHIVLEVTDDKRLPKAERKRIQEEHSPHLSPSAKLVKLADKIANVFDIAENPPPDWSVERRQDYLDWATRVVAGCRGVNAALESRFDEVVRQTREQLGKTD